MKKKTITFIFIVIAIAAPFFTLSIESESSLSCKYEHCGTEAIKQWGWPVAFVIDSTYNFSENKYGQLRFGNPFVSSDNFRFIRYTIDVFLFYIFLNYSPKVIKGFLNSFHPTTAR